MYSWYSLLSSTAQIVPTINAQDCTEEELLDKKDIFSEVKRAFIEQRVQAEIARQLRGPTGRNSSLFFQDLDINKSLVTPLYESTKHNTQTAKAEVLKQQEAMHDLCGSLASSK